MSRIELGDKVKDKITGIEGIIVAITEWLYGCRRVCIQPQIIKDGKPVDNCTIDEPQAELIEKKFINDGEDKKENPKRSYGDRENVGERENII